MTGNLPEFIDKLNEMQDEYILAPPQKPAKSKKKKQKKKKSEETESEEEEYVEN